MGSPSPPFNFKYQSAASKGDKGEGREVTGSRSYAKDFQHDSVGHLRALFRVPHTTELRKILKIFTEGESEADRREEALFSLPSTWPYEQRLSEKKTCTHENCNSYHHPMMHGAPRMSWSPSPQPDKKTRPISTTTTPTTPKVSFPPPPPNGKKGKKLLHQASIDWTGPVSRRETEGRSKWPLVHYLRFG